MESQLDAARACGICGNNAGNKIHSVREMMLGFRDVFQYLECEGCGCLQLLDPPPDMARYYPSHYTAFRADEPRTLVVQRIRNYLRKRRNQGFLGPRTWFDRFLAGRYPYLQFQAFARIGADRQARILDVGCGSGAVLLDLKELGYENLFGVDRFIANSINYRNGVIVVKGGLEDFVGTSWNVIMFHHSFEHMPEPAGVLRLAASMLAAGGRCLIRIPVLGWAWQHYGVHWGQLDAPRHLFLHTAKSFRLLAQAAGLDVQAVSYDSNEFQFWVSELYSRDVPLASLARLVPPPDFSSSQLRSFRLQAARLNSQARGDSAVFDLIKP